MYEVSVPITIPNTSSEGTNVEKRIDLKQYNIKECNIYEGFCVLTNKNIINLPVWVGSSQGSIGVRIYYNPTDKVLIVANATIVYNSAKGYVTLHYNKNN